MGTLVDREPMSVSLTVRQWWARSSAQLMRAAVGALAILACLKLGDEIRRLLWETGKSGAIDLKLFVTEVQTWFSGAPVYGAVKSAVYPPASYLLMWPLMGWLSETPARWLWALTTLLSAAWAVRLFLRESGADQPVDKAFAALLLLSMNATGVAVGNGQLILHQLPMLVSAALLLRRGPSSWTTDLVAAGLMLISLVKPPIAAPFFWLVVFLPGRLRPALMVVLGYAGLTALSAWFQPADMITLLSDWRRHAVFGVRHGSRTGGYANLHSLMADFGLLEWGLSAAIVALSAFGWWVFRHRQADIWLLLGVTGIVARLWAYHRVYDDVLIVLPLVALYRLARHGADGEGTDVVAGVMLGVTLGTMLFPARWQHLPDPWNLLFTSGHAVVWMMVLSLLLYRIEQERCRGASA
jgi:hypothetical protein